MQSIDSAIKRGRWLLLWVPIIILLVGSGLLVFVFLSFIACDIIWINIVSSIVILVLPAFLSFFYFFLMLPIWRIWAFSNVRNVHELKQQAILRKIYPNDSSFIWRLEIKNDDQKHQIEELQRKFNVPDVFVDDLNIPSETNYTYSLLLSFGYLVFTIGSLILTIIAIMGRELWLCLILLPSSICLVILTYQRFKLNGVPLLKLSDEGIATLDNGFFEWKDIENEQIMFTDAGKKYYGLSFQVNGEIIKIHMNEITGLRTYKLDHLLRIYRGRYQNLHHKSK